MRPRAAFFFLACICSALSAGEPTPPEQRQGQAIGLVKTWNDLAKRPSVELRKNATARIGVQTLSAPLNSGVMIYCMTEAYDPADETDDVGEGESRVGPFRLMVHAPDDDDDPAKAETPAVARTLAKRDYGRLVFGQLIAMEKPGAYTVELRDDTNRIVASAKIECVNRPYHAWTTLTSPDEVPADTELEGVAGGSFSTAAGVVASPMINGSAPLLYVLSGGERGPRKFSEDDALPTVPDAVPEGPVALTPSQLKKAGTWIVGLGSDDFKTRWNASGLLVELGPPAFELLQKAARDTRDAETLLRIRLILAQSHGGFSIRLDASDIVIHTPSFFAAVDVEQYFLARWWVNGKPVAPNKDAVTPAASPNGGVPAHRDARLRLKFDPVALGAKRGDTVGLQLLFCPDGTRSASQESAESSSLEVAPAPGDDGEAEGFLDRFPVASNKIEFTLP